MGKPGEADPCDRPQKFTKGTYKTFNEQATWRPIPAIGQNYPHHMFCLCSPSTLSGADVRITEPTSAILWQLRLGGHLNMGTDAGVHVCNEILGADKEKSASKKKIFLQPMQGHRL